MKWLLMPLAAVAALVALALPSGGKAGARAVQVSLTEFAVQADRTEVPAGRVTFETRNDGRIEHELLILKTDLAPGDIPVGLEGPSLKLAGKLFLGTPHKHASLEDALRRRHILPGRARRDTVTLTPGRYVLLCNLPQHYESGQSTALVVR